MTAAELRRRGPGQSRFPGPRPGGGGHLGRGRRRDLGPARRRWTSCWSPTSTCPPPSGRRPWAGPCRRCRPGGLIVVVGHARANLTDGYGGPQDPDILLEPDEVAADLGRATVQRAEHVTRTVSTDEGEQTAIDALVVARAAPASD